MGLKGAREKKCLRIGVLDTPITSCNNSFNHMVISKSKTTDATEISHGDICATLIDQLVDSGLKIEIYCISVLDINGCGNLAKIVETLNWCADCHIDVVNMSLGSVSMKDYSQISTAIVRYIQSGGIVIAAMNNMGKYSMPANIFPVIGVSCRPSLIYRCLGGIEIDCNDVQSELTIAGKRHRLTKSNSYAAAVVTAKIVNQYYKYIISNRFCMIDFVNDMREKMDSRKVVQPFLPEYITSQEKKDKLDKRKEHLGKRSCSLVVLDESDLEKVEGFCSKIFDEIYNIILLGNVESKKKEKIQKYFGPFFWDITEYEKALRMVRSIKSSSQAYPYIKLELAKWDIEQIVRFQEYLQKKGYNVKICVPWREGLLHSMFYIPNELINRNLCCFLCRTFCLDLFVYVDSKDSKCESDFWDLDIDINCLKNEDFSAIIGKVESYFVC